MIFIDEMKLGGRPGDVVSLPSRREWSALKVKYFACAQSKRERNSPSMVMNKQKKTNEKCKYSHPLRCDVGRERASE